MATQDIPSNKFIVDFIKNKSVDEACKYLSNEVCPEVSYKTLQKELSRLSQKFQHLNKSKGRVKGKENLKRFLQSPFHVPKPVSDSDKTFQCSSKSVSQPFSSDDDPHLKAETYKGVCAKLADEVTELTAKHNDLSEELSLVVEEKDELNESLEIRDKQLEQSKKTLKRTANREAYWRDKCLKLDEKGDNEIDINILLKAEISELKDTLKAKDKEIKDIKQLLNELQVENEHLKQVQDANFFDETSQSYVTELHECVYSLLDCQVSCENTSNVIRTVCSLLGKNPVKLPTSRTINNWSIERSIIARKHIADVADKPTTTLHTDEASKYGQKWGAFATRDVDGNYLLLGLRDMATKSSYDTLDTFKEILNDIDLVSSGETGVGGKILANIKNTMSDRASTETKFNSMLKEYREEILPTVFENFNDMNEDSKQALSRMNNFFCGLHTLVHMADVSQKTLLEVEKSHFDEETPIQNISFKKAGQSGTVRTILTACKAFARRGDQKSGCHQGFKVFISEFLKHNKLLSLPLEPLRGNRFNILFSNAGHVYFLRDKMVEYLKKIDKSNGLLQSVLFDLEIPFFVSGCKALGLVSKYITTPLWRVIENKEISISEMNGKYLQLLTFLHETVENLDKFIKGECILFPEVDIKADKILETLLQPSEHDTDVILILSVVLPALAKLIQHQYGDHLPGGIHETVSVEETQSVDKHNKYPERVFSLVDHILSAKPNISTLALEAHIAFSLNKTGDWLKQQDNIKEIIKESRSEVSKERQRFKERASVILAKRIEKQEEDFRKKEIQERKRVEKLEKDTNEMLYYGLWQSPSQVEESLSEITKMSEKEKALKVQLRFRKNVFKQVCDRKDVYTFSKVVEGNRVPLSVEELKDNVVYLIGQTYQTPPENDHILVGKQIQHKWLENNEPKWYNGRVVSQVPGFPAWFNVVYENDPAVYTAKLGEDYREGDVVIKA